MHDRRQSFGIETTRSARKRFALHLGTCLTGAAAALLVAAPAHAQDACGPLLTLQAVTCPAGTDYPDGINYSLPYGATPEDLTVHLEDGITVATDADYTHGVTLTNFAGGSIAVIADGASTISTTGLGSIGVAAIAMDGDVTVHVGDVHTTGAESHGIVAGTPYGAVDVQAGTVITEGDGAFGIRASGYQGPVTVAATAVQTSGLYATGVSAHSSGDVSVDVGSVHTSGDYSVGIDAQVGLPPLIDYDTGEVTLSPAHDLTVHAGDVATRGYGSDGVIATNFTRGSTNVAVDSIKTEGDNSWGAYAGGFGDVSLSVGSTETSGFGSVGLGAVSFYGDIAVSGDSVTTHGDFAGGVNVLNYNLNGATTITVGSVVTDGDRATGIYMGGAYFDGNEGQVTTITDDHVETHGKTSTGVAILTGGDLNVTLGDVLVEGDQSRGVVINSGLGDVNLTIDSIVTKGESQLGRDTAGLAVANNHGTVNATIGSIETSSHHSPAILTNGYDTDQNFTITGGLSTSGDFASAFQAYIDTGSLTLDAASIATDGAFSNGVLATVNAGDMTIHTGTLTTKGDYSAGISATEVSFDGIGHQISIDADSVTTQGYASEGIKVQGYGANADIHAGTITTSGAYSAGVAALGVAGVDYYGNVFGGNLDIDVGTVKTSGDYSPGVLAVADGAITVHADSITTDGRRSAGIHAYGYGDITIDAGSVETHGYRSDGIYANNNVGGLSGGIDITAGSVVTTGYASTGINAQAYYGSTHVKVDSVKTSGYGSDAIFGWSYWGDTTIEAGSVDTSGTGARGITAYSGGTTTVIAGDVTTSGDGIFSDFDAGAIKAVGAAVHVEAGNVSTSGNYSTGIYANSNFVHDNGQIDRDISVTADSVTTSGYASHGVVAINVASRSQTSIDVGSVKTSGDYAIGIYAAAPAGDISIKADSISTGGVQAPGVVAVSYYGDISVDVGSVTTEGLGSPGIYTYAGGGPRAHGTTTIHAGSVTTSGDYSAGIQAIGLGEDISLDITADKVSTDGIASRGVFAYGLGDISVTAGDISTKGDGAIGIQGFSFYGDVTVSADKIATEGALAAGIYASTLTGDVTVTAGDISTKGDLSQGVRAYSGSGDVAVTTTGAVSTEGAYAYGVLAFGGGAVTIDNQGSVATSGETAHGLYALGRGSGTTSVSNSGSVAVSGDYSTGIRAVGAGGDGVKIVSTGTVSAEGNYVSGIIGVVPRAGRGERVEAAADDAPAAPMLDIDAASVTVSGQSAAGILALNYRGDIHVKADSVKVDSAGTGVTAMGVGAVDIEVGDVSSSGGRGVLVIAGGAASVTVTGDVVTPNHVAVEMGASGAKSVLNVASGASITGGGLRNPADGEYTGPGNAIIMGSDMGVEINNAGTIRNLGDRYTIFVTDQYGYDGQPVFGPGATITNSGVLEGNLRLTAGNDTITNSGTFIATRDSVFGEGEDLFVNTGTVKIEAAPVPAGTARAAAAGTSVTLSGLETFRNMGTVDLRNGVAGDTLTLPGNFIGSGASTVAVDVGPSGADKFVVQGAATGSTAVVIAADPTAATLLANPVDIIQTGAGSSADAFTLANADVGLIRYGMAFDAATGTFSVTSAAGAPVYRLAKLNEGAQAVWQQSATAWSTHMAQLRDIGATGSGLWGQMYGSVVNRDGTNAGSNVDYRQDFYGGQLGYDLGGAQDAAHSFAFGVTGGYLSSHQNFKASAERVTFDTVNLGGYGSFRAGPLFANLLAQYDHYWVKAQNSSMAAHWKDSVGGDAYGVEGQIGARLGSGRLFAEPAVSLAWQHSDIGSIMAYGQSIDFDGSNALTGKAGARVGGSVGLGGSTTGVFYVRGNYVHEFDGKSGLLFTSGGVSQAIANVRPGDYGEGAVGLTIGSAGPVSGFLEGDAIFGSSAKGGGGRVGIRFQF